jgi:hypothetical protein
MLRFSIQMKKKPKNVKKNCVNLLAGSAIVFTTRFVRSPVHYVHAQTARLHITSQSHGMKSNSSQEKPATLLGVNDIQTR